MLSAVDVAYADTTAAALGLWLDLPRQPALDVLALDVGGVALELRLLGASHQVVAPGLTETVACREGEVAALPARAERAAGPRRYAFASRVERLSAPAFAARARAVRDRAAADPLALAGVFPGSPDALTAIACRPVRGGAAWRTVHLYPATGELVETTATLTAGSGEVVEPTAGLLAC